jgi:hypothetical protein
VANLGDFDDPAFDPAKAIQGLRQAEEDEKQRQALARANRLKLLRHAEKELEEIRAPVVSEFVVNENWWIPEHKTVSDKRAPEDFKRILQPWQWIARTDKGGSFFRPRFVYTVATAQQRQRQTRYYGSWLWLKTTYYTDRCDWGTYSHDYTWIKGLVKLCQPHTGYAYVITTAAGHGCPKSHSLVIELTDRQGRKKKSRFPLQLYASLKDVANLFPGHNLQANTEIVKQTLDFVKTGQPPKPEIY